MTPAVQPPHWDPATFTRESARATALFREERTLEPLEEYTEHFFAARSVLEEVLEVTVDLSLLLENASALLSDARTSEAVRYLTGPPVSRDDLQTTAEVVLSPAAIRRDEPSARRAMEVVLLSIDRNRFPWLSEDREPTESERLSATMATAAMIASRKVVTARANGSKSTQERKVKDALLEHGFTEVSTRTISTLVDAPGPGEFCGESMFGQKKADVVVRLWDNRVMPLECKVSNSATNSVKRLNGDAAAKATVWIGDFGKTQVVPAAMLAGVFKTRNLVEAQSNGLTVWWSHDLEAMTRWIESTRA